MIIISTVNDCLLTLETKNKIEKALKEVVTKLNTQVNSLKSSDLCDYSYEECEKLYNQIQYYIDDKGLLDELFTVIEKKKSELTKPTYCPEIDLLDISDSEKIRLDKAVRNNIRNYIDINNIKNHTYSLSIEDMELLKSIGIIEIKYVFRCSYCGSLCTIISESDLNKYKKYWQLVELKKQKIITNSQLEELNQLDEDGFYEIYLSCMNEDDCDIEITNEKELSNYMSNVEVVYKIVKNLDLTKIMK